jgi:hypothetical protein
MFSQLERILMLPSIIRKICFHAILSTLNDVSLGALMILIKFCHSMEGSFSIHDMHTTVTFKLILKGSSININNQFISNLLI